MTEEDNINFRNATKCFVCGKPLKNDKVRDHDHITGIYRGACHNACNLNVKTKRKIPASIVDAERENIERLKLISPANTDDQAIYTSDS